MKTPLPKFLFNNVAGLRPVTLLKTRLWHKCFPVNFVKFLRTPFFLETNSPIIKMNTLQYKTTDKTKAFILYVILKRNLKFYIKSIHFLIKIWFSVSPFFVSGFLVSDEWHLKVFKIHFLKMKMYLVHKKDDELY